MYPIRALKRPKLGLGELLEPISPEAPCGELLRYEGTYDRIQAARAEDDPVLARGVWKLPLKRADWAEVERLSVEALEKRTKDLQIAVWLTEAWVHLDGFAGLGYGLRLTASLCLRFWNGLHPGEGPDALEYRIAPIQFLNEKLPVLVKLLPLTNPSSDDVKAYCWADWETGATRSALAGSSAPTQAQFQQSAMLTQPNFFFGLLADVETSIAACTELESVLEKQCGNDAPSLRQLWSAMESIRELFASIVNQRGEGEAGQEQPAEAAAPSWHNSSAEPDAQAEASTSAGPIRSRAEAYRRLSEAADFLSRTEPHSPAPYLIRRAIAWGSMRLEDLLPELVHNHAELGEIFRLLQIPKGPE